jgi:uncharacterized protein (DUF302 family)
MDVPQRLGAPHMSSEVVTTTYSIPEPFALGLEAVREALTDRDLKIIGQLDLSQRIRRNLRIHLEPCVVFYVWPPGHLLQTIPAPSSLGLFLPLHVVVSGCGGRTEIHVLKRARLEDEAAMAAVGRLQAEVAQALETVAMRRSLVS